VINNYTQSGGRFFKKEDLRKIYGLDAQTYSRLEKYIKIENRTSGKVENSAPAREALPVIELNTADTFRLALLRGIGPVYARRICKYRDLLGGFVSKKQLEEVYGITEDLVSINDTILSIDREEINKIDVNKAKFVDLIRHPYLNEYQTRAILQYRKYRKRINDLSELVSNNILDKETYQLMKPYLEAGAE
jgi:DNA uptake protein ComE-like DNA-binding protein